MSARLNKGHAQFIQGCKNLSLIVCKKSVLQIFILLFMNVKSDPISYSWNFEVGSYGQILRKTWLNLLVPSLSMGTWSLILAICWCLIVQISHGMVRLKQTVNSEGKNSLEPFSKEFKVVLLYSIKTVVSHLKQDETPSEKFIYTSHSSRVLYKDHKPTWHLNYMQIDWQLTPASVYKGHLWTRVDQWSRSVLWIDTQTMLTLHRHLSWHS